MARHLYERFPHTCAPMIDRCLEELATSNVELASIVRACLFHQHDALDRHVQLLLFITEFALVSLLRALSIRPDYLIGQSCGEFVAACPAGVMSLETALHLPVQRCQLMANAPASSMLAVRIEPNKDDAMDLATTYDVDLAVRNSSTQVIYAGPIEGIQRMQNELRQRGIQVKV